MPAIEHDFSRPGRPVTIWEDDTASPEARFRAAEQIVDDEIATLTRADMLGPGDPPPRHRGPDGPFRNVGWVAAAGAVALGLAWIAVKTATTFLEVQP